MVPLSPKVGPSLFVCKALITYNTMILYNHVRHLHCVCVFEYKCLCVLVQGCACIGVGRCMY